MKPIRQNCLNVSEKSKRYFWKQVSFSGNSGHRTGNGCSRSPQEKGQSTEGIVKVFKTHPLGCSEPGSECNRDFSPTIGYFRNRRPFARNPYDFIDLRVSQT